MLCEKFHAKSPSLLCFCFLFTTWRFMLSLALLFILVFFSDLSIERRRSWATALKKAQGKLVDDWRLIP